MFVPDRGDITFLDFNPQTGRGQAGRRPALVLSPKRFNERTGYASLCPISETTREWGFHVDLPENLSVRGLVITVQIKNLDFKARHASFVLKVPDEVVTECLKKIRTFL